MVTAYYDRLASSYGDGELFGARRAAVLAAIAPELSSARSILDLGCGNGAYLAEFVARVPAAHVVGADLSPEMLRAARRRVGSQADLARANACALPFTGARFDIVFMSHVLQLVADVDQCITEAAACVSDGGWLISTVGTGGWRAAVAETLGADNVQELAVLIKSVRSRARAADDRADVDAACTHADLAAQYRDAPLSVTWAAFEEWMRIRWLGLVDDAKRAQAEEWLDRVRSSNADRVLSIKQSVLVARKVPHA